MNKKKWIAIFLLIVILLLDWAALDGITTGNEPNYIGEYIILALSFISFPFIYSFFKSK